MRNMNAPAKKRDDRLDAKDALEAYLRARIPTTELTHRLIGALSQLIANDAQSTVAVAIGKNIAVMRDPSPLTVTI